MQHLSSTPRWQHKRLSFSHLYFWVKDCLTRREPKLTDSRASRYSLPHLHKRQEFLTDDFTKLRLPVSKQFGLASLCCLHMHNMTGTEPLSLLRNYLKSPHHSFSFVSLTQTVWLNTCPSEGVREFRVWKERIDLSTKHTGLTAGKYEK